MLLYNVQYLKARVILLIQYHYIISLMLVQYLKAGVIAKADPSELFGRGWII